MGPLYTPISTVPPPRASSLLLCFLVFSIVTKSEKATGPEFSGKRIGMEDVGVEFFEEGASLLTV